MNADAFAHEIIVDVLNNSLQAQAKKILMNCDLLVYKVKTVKRGNVDLKTLLNNAEEAAKVKKNQQENPEA